MGACFRLYWHNAPKGGGASAASGKGCHGERLDVPSNRWAPPAGQGEGWGVSLRL